MVTLDFPIYRNPRNNPQRPSGAANPWQDHLWLLFRSPLTTRASGYELRAVHRLILLVLRDPLLHFLL